MRNRSGTGGRIAATWKVAAVLLIVVALVPAGTALAQDDGACGSTYTIVVGDTLYSIAQTCGTTVEALLDANTSITDPSVIYVGTELTIPGGEDDADEPEDDESAEDEPAVAISPDSGVPGTFVDVVASGFPADEEVTVGVGVDQSEPTTTVTEMTDEDGVLATTVTIPEDEAEGGETWVVIVSTGGVDAVEASADFAVEDEAAGDDGEDEPDDGEDASGTYTVQPGDTLYSIAQRYGTTVEALLDANTDILDASVIRVGQVINVPSVDQGGGGEDDADDGTDEDMDDGEDEDDASDDEEDEDMEEGGTYTVVAGDTLYSIAQRYETTVGGMLDLNPTITNESVIYVGQVLNVP